MLDLLLSVEFRGAAELRAQLSSAMVDGGCRCGCPSVYLVVTDPGAPMARLDDRLAPAGLDIEASGDGVPGGEVMLFVDHGRLSYLEYVFYSDSPPQDWPGVDRLSVNLGPA